VSSIALAFSMNGDRLLLGLWLTPAILGYYSIAAGLATMVEGIGNRLFSNLSFPALSEVALFGCDGFRTRDSFGQLAFSLPQRT
jgi:O-antigen/teichoic acid export membrane protein